MDLFILRNHKGEASAVIDISDKPTNFDKLVAFGLDPLIYRINWLGPDHAYIWEFWWGTTPFYINRISEIDIKDYANIVSFKKKIRDNNLINLPKGGASSPSHLHDNFMI